MVNGLHIIIYTPLFSVRIPANTKHFFAAIAEVLEFSILPSDWIGADMFKFKEEEPFTEDFELMDIF